VKKVVRYPPTRRVFGFLSALFVVVGINIDMPNNDTTPISPRKEAVSENSHILHRMDDSRCDQPRLLQ